VPVLLGLAYIGMAYLSWTLARLIVGRPEALIAGPRVFAMPAVASCIMVAWDWAQDPVWGTILHAWR
jgi:putative membrane protein